MKNAQYYQAFIRNRNPIVILMLLTEPRAAMVVFDKKARCAAPKEKCDNDHCEYGGGRSWYTYQDNLFQRVRASGNLGTIEDEKVWKWLEENSNH